MSFLIYLHLLTVFSPLPIELIDLAWRRRNCPVTPSSEPFSIFPASFCSCWMVILICVELTFLICRIDLFDLAGTHVDMYPYLVANISISNVDKLKIMATVSSVLNNPAVGYHYRLSPSISSLLRL